MKYQITITTCQIIIHSFVFADMFFELTSPFRRCIYFSRTEGSVHLHVLFYCWCILKERLSLYRQNFAFFCCTAAVVYFLSRETLWISAENKPTPAHQLSICLSLSQFSKCQGVAVHHSLRLLSCLSIVFCLSGGEHDNVERGNR